MARNSTAEHLNFLRGLIARPRNVGAVAPSSPALARAIAAQIEPQTQGPVLELGPGTGVITEALIERGISPGRITAIEYDADFVQHIAARFPDVRVIEGDAFDLDATLGSGSGEKLAAVISGLPLLNHPMARRRALIANALARLAPGAPFVQFSYGWKPPVPADARTSVTHADFVLANLPPAHVWVYRRL